MSLFSTVTMDSASNFRTIWADEVKRREKKGGEKTVLSFGQPLQPRRRGGCLSKPKNHHQLTCKAILHHHDRLFKRPQGFLWVHSAGECGGRAGQKGAGNGRLRQPRRRGLPM